MVRQLSISLHERISTSRSCFHHLKNRVCCRIPAHARKACPLSPWLPRHWHAHKGPSPYPPISRICPHPLSQASADKIIREIGLFGPDFDRYEQVQAELDQAAEEKDAEPDQANVVDKSKAKKGKLIAKSTGLTYQFQIMESIGVPRAEIKKFADPLHWLKVFPPIAIVSPPLSLCYPHC
jgi:hypothetical protein